jgi:hypothetical protein
MGHRSSKEHAHDLIDRMAPVQVAAVVGLLETMLDPFARALVGAPIDNEPETEEERKAVDASRAWLRQHPEGIANEEVLAEFGLSRRRSKRFDGVAVKEIVWSDPAREDLRRMDRFNAIRLLIPLRRFSQTGEGEIQKMPEEQGELRLRVGEYRIRLVEETHGVLHIHSLRQRPMGTKKIAPVGKPSKPIRLVRSGRG